MDNGIQILVSGATEPIPEDLIGFGDLWMSASGGFVFITGNHWFCGFIGVTSPCKWKDYRQISYMKAPK